MRRFWRSLDSCHARADKERSERCGPTFDRPAKGVGFTTNWRRLVSDKSSLESFMTSGQFHSVLLDSIIINREERHRSVLTGIDELALSIKNRSLIHPPVITREHV